MYNGLTYKFSLLLFFFYFTVIKHHTASRAVLWMLNVCLHFSDVARGSNRVSRRLRDQKEDHRSLQFSGMLYHRAGLALCTRCFSNA